MKVVVGDRNRGRAPSAGDRPTDTRFLEDMHGALSELATTYGTDATVDLAFLAFIQKFSRFGYFTHGPVTIDVGLIEDVVERTVSAGVEPGPGAPGHADNYVRFTRVLMDEIRRSGRRTADERHYLLALMRCGEGLPARVFGELGVTPEQVERYTPAADGRWSMPGRLFSPEEVADYLGVHVQTVRAWIRSGRLPASRIAGQRVLRIRAADVEDLLEPVEAGSA